MRAASHDKAACALANKGVQFVDASSLALCATNHSNLVAKPFTVVQQWLYSPSRLRRLYPVAAEKVEKKSKSSFHHEVQPHSHSIAHSEETDAHYKQHTNDAMTEDFSGGNMTSISSSSTSTLDHPLDLYGG